MKRREFVRSMGLTAELRRLQAFYGDSDELARTFLKDDLAGAGKK